MVQFSTEHQEQWNLPERPLLVKDHLTKISIGSSISQIALSETFRKWPPPVSDHLSVTSRVAAYERFHCTYYLPFLFLSEHL